MDAAELGSSESSKLLYKDSADSNNNNDHSDVNLESTTFRSYRGTVVSLLVVVLMVIAVAVNYHTVLYTSENLDAVGTQNMYSSCVSLFEKDFEPVKIPTQPGCVYLLSRNLEGPVKYSPMATVCSCVKQAILIDHPTLISLNMTGPDHIVSRIAFVATGADVNVIFHEGPKLTGAEFILGPNSQTRLVCILLFTSKHSGHHL